MPRDLTVIQSEIEKTQGEYNAVKARQSREEAESHLVAYLAQARGAAAARISTREAICSGGGVGDFERAIALGVYAELCRPEAREALYVFCRPVLAGLVDAKTKTKQLSGLQKTLDRVRGELREAELDVARAEIDRRAAAFEAEQNAAANA